MVLRNKPASQKSEKKLRKRVPAKYLTHNLAAVHEC